MSFHTTSAHEICGTDVTNHQGEALGLIKDVMIDMTDGTVAYLVLSHGGVFGTTLADKRFAVPFSAFSRVQDKKDIKYLLNVQADFLDDAPGFDKDNYPDFADPQFQEALQRYYQEHVPQRKAA